MTYGGVTYYCDLCPGGTACELTGLAGSSSGAFMCPLHARMFGWLRLYAYVCVCVYMCVCVCMRVCMCVVSNKSKIQSVQIYRFYIIIMASYFYFSITLFLISISRHLLQSSHFSSHSPPLSLPLSTSFYPIFYPILLYSESIFFFPFFLACAAGYWCNIGAVSKYATCSSTFCTSMYGICPPGFSCPLGSMLPTVCGDGYYMNR